MKTKHRALVALLVVLLLAFAAVPAGAQTTSGGYECYYSYNGGFPAVYCISSAPGYDYEGFAMLPYAFLLSLLYWM